MGAGIEPLSAVIRVGDHFHEHGDPYQFAGSVRYITPVFVEIVGLASNARNVTFAPRHWRWMKQALANEGVEKALFQRRRGDKVHTKTVTCR